MRERVCACVREGVCEHVRVIRCVIGRQRRFSVDVPGMCRRV